LPVPERWQYPALGDLHADFDFGFIARFVGPCWNDCRVVVPCKIGVSAIDRRLVKAGVAAKRASGTTVMPDFRLSETTCAVTPPKKLKARQCEPVQSGRLCVQVASA